jgi:hypothetical protein
VPDRTILVWADTVKVARCRSEACGARIFFAETVATGRTTPFTGEPVPLRTSRDAESGRNMYEFDYEDSHFRSCPDAERFSGSKRGRR